MNRRYLEGKWKLWKGAVLEQVGKLTGDKKLQQSGEAQRVRGKIQTLVEDVPNMKDSQ